MNFQISRLGRWKVAFKNYSFEIDNWIDSGIMVLPVEKKEEKWNYWAGEMFEENGSGFVGSFTKHKRNAWLIKSSTLRKEIAKRYSGFESVETSARWGV